MKNNIFSIIAILIVSLSACNKSLDLNPLDQISSDNFWKTKSDFDKGLAANYASLQAPMWSYELPNWDCITDNAYGQHNYGSSKDITSGSISSTTGGYISGLYNTSYKAIARANLFLGELGKYSGTEMNENDKKMYEAEVRFLRAFYYFQLYAFYGDVPLILTPVMLENQAQPKEGANKIFEQIIADLDFAIANLSDASFTESSGHATATTAQAFKARVLIFEAYGTTGTPNIAMLTEVRDLTLQVQSKYSLSPKFENLFQDAGQKGNPEIIFSVNFLAPDNVAQWDLWYGDWIVVSPLPNFINEFEYLDGLPAGVSPLTNLNNPFENRDPRLEKTVFKDVVDWGNGNVHFPTNNRPTSYGLKKFLEPKNIPYGYSTLSQQNAILLRLGEVLLMYSEAQNEISGPDASVYKALTDLRARVQMPPLPAGLSKEQMREKIRHERRIELAFEGLRYFDLKRWHIASPVLNNVKDGLLPYNFQDKFYKWPLPQAEIDKNQGILIQNPNY